MLYDLVSLTTDTRTTRRGFVELEAMSAPLYVQRLCSEYKAHGPASTAGTAKGGSGTSRTAGIMRLQCYMIMSTDAALLTSHDTSNENASARARPQSSRRGTAAFSSSLLSSPRVCWPAPTTPMGLLWTWRATLRKLHLTASRQSPRLGSAGREGGRRRGAAA